MKIVVNGYVFNSEIDIIDIVFDTDADRKNVALILTSMPDKDGIRHLLSVPDSIHLDQNDTDNIMDEAELLSRINFESHEVSRHTKNTSKCCLKADPLEPVFMLRAKDPIATIVVGVWRELARKSNLHEQSKITGATEVINEMLEWREKMKLGNDNPFAIDQQGVCSVSFYDLPGYAEFFSAHIAKFIDQPFTVKTVMDIKGAARNFINELSNDGTIENYSDFDVIPDVINGRIEFMGWYDLNITRSVDLKSLTRGI